MPSEVTVAAINDTALRVDFNNDISKSFQYLYAYVKTHPTKNCTLEENKSSCDITELLPYSAYTVEVLGCTDKMDRDSCSVSVEIDAHTKPSGKIWHRCHYQLEISIADCSGMQYQYKVFTVWGLV